MEAIRIICIAFFGFLAYIGFSQREDPGGENNIYLGIVCFLITLYLLKRLIQKSRIKKDNFFNGQKRLDLLHDQSMFFSLRDIEGYENDDVEQYQILATLDNKTCEACGNLDRKIFWVKAAKVGVNLPPFHTGCRCTTVPYYDDTDLSNMMRVARDPVTGKPYEVSADMTWKEWKKSIK